MAAHLFSDAAVSRLVHRQMSNWEIARSQRVRDPAGEVQAVQDFVTVSRTLGSGGGHVARTLGERLGWGVFDKQILDAMARNDDIRRQLYESMDERDLSWFEQSLSGLPADKSPQHDYFRRLSETVLSLARQAPAVFAGRAADVLLPRDRGLRLRIVAPLEERTRRYAERMNLDAEPARTAILKSDQDRNAFVQRHFRVDAADATRYDLVINTDRWTENQAVDLILAAMRMRGMVLENQG